jgi:hypothetical protein
MLSRFRKFTNFRQEEGLGDGSGPVGFRPTGLINITTKISPVAPCLTDHVPN